jgi:transposase
MDQINDIRNRYYAKGENITQISGAMKLDRKTVRKYVEKEDWNRPAPRQASEKQICPKLDGFKPVIDQWLEDDKKAKRKQRHTAQRVYDRLSEEFPDTFRCSYRTVATYYKRCRAEVFSGLQESFIPLLHSPGEAQVDFGDAQFVENGKLCDGKYLVVSFPSSNQGYLQLFHGENMECLLEGMDAVFRHIRGVPYKAWFDNTKTIVTKVMRGGGRETTERFERFREHYHFEAVFCNPDAGHEKGSVENKVGYLRRNLLVPIPEFASLSEYNKELLTRCDKDSRRDHYRKNETIEALFCEDRNALNGLPKNPLDLAKLMSVKTNSCGKFVLFNTGRHEYSVSPKHSDTFVNLRITSGQVIAMDENWREIIRHPRLYGPDKQESMNWIPYLNQLSKRPRALKYTGIYEMMPQSLQDLLERCTNTETGGVLKVMSALTEKSGFESAVKAVSSAAEYGASDMESLKNIHRKLYSDTPELPPMPFGDGIPKLAPMPPDLSAYDSFLAKGGGADAR